MKDAMLIRDLEKRGFYLEFPSYNSIEDEIIEILLMRKERLNLAIPLLLQKEFDYGKIISKLTLSKRDDNKEIIETFNKIIIITNKIFELEGMGNNHIIRIIDEYNLNYNIKKSELEYYHSEFINSIRNKEERNEKLLNERIKMRKKLSLNKALAITFSEGKIKIMNKIFNHEPLTNSELKYYYRSIRPLIISILNDKLGDYLETILSIKKILSINQQLHKESY
ncbi:MAG: hypothetical protein U9R34_03775 [Nanoarchaeota archaeon]|nr:hypothetical protein [Nanoarchaeota archaeon]